MPNSKQPSQDEIREFWEWCGFKYVSIAGMEDLIDEYDHLNWEDHNGEICEELPPIDLNNLFKYAVPKLEGRTRIHFYSDTLSVTVFEEVGSKAGSPLYYEHRCDNLKDPALALFWAIWGVIEGEVINE